jgi:putative tricarboxylic transport membrane protein
MGEQAFDMIKRAEIALLFWIALGIFILIQSYGMGLGALGSPGAGLMPFLVGALLVVFSLFSLLRRLYGKGDLKGLPAASKERPQLRRIGIVLGGLVGYALLLERLGYLVTSFLMLAILFRNMGTARTVAVGISLGTVVATYLVFSYFGVVFPLGILDWKGFSH